MVQAHRLTVSYATKESIRAETFGTLKIVQTLVPISINIKARIVPFRKAVRLYHDGGSGWLWMSIGTGDRGLAADGMRGLQGVSECNRFVGVGGWQPCYDRVRRCFVAIHNGCGISQRFVGKVLGKRSGLQMPSYPEGFMGLQPEKHLTPPTFFGYYFIS